MNRPVPVSLQIVAWANIVLGALAIVGMLIDLTRGRLMINLSVLQLPMGIGLLRLSRGWRTFGVVWTWIGLILLPVVAVLVLVLGLRTFSSAFGGAMGGLAVAVVVGMVAAFEGLLALQLAVLNSKRVVEAFNPEPAGGFPVVLLDPRPPATPPPIPPGEGGAPAPSPRMGALLANDGWHPSGSGALSAWRRKGNYLVAMAPDAG